MGELQAEMLKALCLCASVRAIIPLPATCLFIVIVTLVWQSEYCLHDARVTNPPQGVVTKTVGMVCRM